MDKRQQSETDMETKYIIPALHKAGWDVMTQVFQQFPLTAGKVHVRGQVSSRGKPQRADFALFYKPNIPLAIIEAKKNTKSIGAGQDQGRAYAQMLDVPFVFTSNGDGFIFHDKTNLEQPNTELTLDQFPTPSVLWEKLCRWKDYQPDQQALLGQDYYDDGSGKAPRYYQMQAINKTIEAIAQGKNRVLLVMATGTGKTFTAFQIIWRLWKAGRKQRILFLADRNILVDQTKNNDFRPFGTTMTKIEDRKVETHYEVYLSLYQAITGNDEAKKIYKQFLPNFFDLIVIDECHRGSAAEDSAWREILDYFSGATHLGLTATPKETTTVSNSYYFGEPIYTYSLKQGIDDGFLAPYKVVRIDFDLDKEGWTPKSGEKDKYGKVIEARTFNQRDFDRSLVVEKRTQAVARIITQHLKATNRMDKTIVFCADVDHANRMKLALENLNGDKVAEDERYIMQITGDNAEGKAQLSYFIDSGSPYPVIATTSELMSTGVDAKTCKLIVLDQRIESMTKFKQVIGRGTRIDEDYGKTWFTIIDFKGATQNFKDDAFDGEPVRVYTPSGEDDGTLDPDETDLDDTDPTPPDDNDNGTVVDPKPPQPRVKYYIEGESVEVVLERTQYYGKDGLVTESIRDYTRQAVSKHYRNLDAFLKHWNAAERKRAIIAELQAHGVIWDELENKVGKELDAFDLICHVVYDQPPLTRRDRALQVKKRDVFTRYGEQAAKVLAALLDKYVEQGVESLEAIEALQQEPIKQLGTPRQIMQAFGGRAKYDEALQVLEQQLYAST
ncbi:MAG: hypothetical protein RL122_2113 [Pseudomonadota bacterium]|jgi:type I restriction enzyme R subunit|uniref:DEAD/DEAH box helicase family protein n=1 Tax=Thiothrix fructosivorans TaxID=111770 RepID=A0A8B0SLR2_9GAMM|nr:DEAD/DEAH box helicase family protein [Thiothrix fructosivorans]MBO0612703.1 DEAD/DEAH box helicase family protein [Thiothrix fructosivorans]QTX11829.1 DEAD/DEAH box helicase family protein [Thiothrix fructosivorans]